MRTCLVVDDSSVIRKVARRILEGLDFQIVEAEDGAKALEVCKRALPDAVLETHAQHGDATARVDAARVVHRIRDEIRRLTGPIDTSGRELHVSASIGFETFDGNDLESVEELRRHAEVALRSAKEMGGHRAVYFRSLGGPVRAETAGE